MVEGNHRGPSAPVLQPARRSERRGCPSHQRPPASRPARPPASSAPGGPGLRRAGGPAAAARRVSGSSDEDVRAMSDESVRVVGDPPTEGAGPSDPSEVDLPHRQSSLK